VKRLAAQAWGLGQRPRRAGVWGRQPPIEKNSAWQLTAEGYADMKQVVESQGVVA